MILLSGYGKKSKAKPEYKRFCTVPEYEGNKGGHHRSCLQYKGKDRSIHRLEDRKINASKVRQDVAQNVNIRYNHNVNKIIINLEGADFGLLLFPLKKGESEGNL